MELRHLDVFRQFYVVLDYLVITLLKLVLHAQELHCLLETILLGNVLKTVL